MVPSGARTLMIVAATAWVLFLVGCATQAVVAEASVQREAAQPSVADLLESQLRR